MNYNELIPDGYDPVQIDPVAPPQATYSKAAHTRAEQSKPVDLPLSPASAFAGLPVPERRSHDAKGMIPHRVVTLVYGEGGSGKSMIAVQLAASTSLIGTKWLGMNVRHGPVLYFSAEDDEAETHIRLSAIAVQGGFSLSELDRLHIAFMAGRECVLGHNDGKGRIVPTPLFGGLERAAQLINPVLLIIDNLIDVYGGDQNDAAQVKQFMHLLTGLAHKANCPVLLLAHPSRSGMANGTGDGGSVAWSNSARSRLLLSRVYSTGDGGQQVEENPNSRVLKVMKANYGATGETIELCWQDGCFVASSPDAGSSQIGAFDRSLRVFMSLLRWHIETGSNVSCHRSPTYAPSVFASHKNAEGINKRAFERAMQSLLEDGKIKVETFGPASRGRSRLVIVEAE